MAKAAKKSEERTVLSLRVNDLLKQIHQLAIIPKCLTVVLQAPPSGIRGVLLSIDGRKSRYAPTIHMLRLLHTSPDLWIYCC